LEEAEVLQSIGEAAVALAGFGGIAAGLGYRAGGSWSNQDRIRLMTLVTMSLAAVFGSFLPFAVHHLGAAEPWRHSSVVLMVAPLGALLTQIHLFRRGMPAGYSVLLVAAGATLSAVVLALLLVVAVGEVSPERQFGLYLTAVLLLFLMAALFFLRLLATSFRGDDSNSD
jgi:hypothetical protein